MAIVSKVLPNTSVFLDTGPNPTQQIITKDLVAGNVGAETFTLRASLLSPPVIPLSQLLGTLNVPNPTIVDYNEFILIYKSLIVAPYLAPQNYAFPVSFELLNIPKIDATVSTEFVEL